MSNDEIIVALCDGCDNTFNQPFNPDEKFDLQLAIKNMAAQGWGMRTKPLRIACPDCLIKLKKIIDNLTGESE